MMEANQPQRFRGSDALCTVTLLFFIHSALYLSLPYPGIVNNSSYIFLSHLRIDLC
jgi:hypothetical protein